ncbi:hypothetical protein D3C73_1406140 [compost metagenome]
MSRETHIPIRTTANGSAATIEAVWRPLSPPLNSSTTAMADCMIPQVNFTLVLGSSLPSEVSMPNTNVAESADVIKKIMIRSVATTAKIVPKGNCSSIRNKAVVVSSLTASARWAELNNSI